MRVTFADVQRNVSEIANRQEYSLDVLYELMAAYGRSAASITKLRNGVINLAIDKEETILQRGVVYFKYIKNTESFPAEIEKLEQDPLTARYNPRYLIATDLVSFAAKDTKKGNTLEIKWVDIDRNVDFFYGWTGDEVTDEKTEAVADRRAADKMKELYYEIEKINRDNLAEKGNNFRHELNVFFTRLLFCFFAEDTKVFSRDNPNIFTNAIRTYSQTDGSDLDQFLDTLFKTLDSEENSDFRATLSAPYSEFPYVNGTLFDTTRNISIPKFNAQARKYILDCGLLNWAEINPDIFGSMFQSIVDVDHRATHGQHYTSVPNITKTIEPLFLDELREEFDRYYDNTTKLAKLHSRISKIKVFDPACGSGNFLIIAYKELRKLEHAIIDKLYEDDFKKAALAGKLTTQINLDNFYGIEIDDFACEVAVLSLYLAKHQMNIEFEKQFGKEIKLIPLKDKANIIKGNAAQIDWQDVCPNKQHSVDVYRLNQQSALIEFEEEQAELELGQKYWDEIYLISNPPYAGFLYQDNSQKEDIDHVFKNYENKRKLDYVSIWFIKGRTYIEGTRAKLAFVSTNSITQGEQVALLWPDIINKNIQIGYAYTSFKWQNNASGGAGVTCVIISLRNRSSNPIYLFNGIFREQVDNINAYLAGADDIYVRNRTKSISKLPKISLGSSPYENGLLMLESSERDQLISKYPDSKKLIREFIGSREFIRSEKRYCLWIDDKDLELALSIPEISSRIDQVREFRLKSKRGKTYDTAATPHRFTEPRHENSPSLIIPIVASEKRPYLVLGLLDGDSVIPNSARAIYNSEPWLFALLSSKMHLIWTLAIAGKLETRIRYSANVYNNYPLPALTEGLKSDLNKTALGILFARENHTENTLAELYDLDKMPKDLREAHHHNDVLVDRLYRQKPFDNDEERLASLFSLYEEMLGMGG